MFVLLSSLVFFAWGEIFSLFPSITADLYGRTWATTSYGIVYTAKGTAAIFPAPVAADVMLLLGAGVLRHDRLRPRRRLHGIAVAETSGGARHRQS